MSIETPLSTLVERAYAALQAEPNSPSTSENAVAAAFSKIATEASPKSAPNATAEAYAQVPSTRALARFDQLEAARGSTAQAFAGISPRTVVSLMNCQSLPPKGMFSALQPSALVPGQFSLLEDVRIDDRSIRARFATTDRSATGLPGTSGSARGIWSGRLNGTVYVAGAWFDGTKVGIYVSTDGVNFSTATQTSGPFNDSRMTDTGQPFAFQVVTNPADGDDYLVIQNGKDAPRVYSPNGFYGTNVRVIQQFAPPRWASSTSALSAVGKSYSSNLVSVTSSSGSGHLSPVLNGSAPNQSVAMTVGTSTVSGDQILFDFGVSGISFGFGRQLLFVSDQASMNAWDNWKVEVSFDNITYVTLSDPTSSTYFAPLRVPFGDPSFLGTSDSGGLGGEEIAAFDTTVVTPVSVSNLQYLRLTWMGQPPAASFTTTIHGILSSGGQLAYNQQYILSYSGLGGLSESAGVVLAGFSARSCSLIPGCGQRTFMPYVAGVFYDHFLPTQVQSQADLENGCDTLNVYRQDAGSGEFFFFESVSFGSYSSGNWVFPGSGTTSPPAFTSSISITYALFGSVALDVSRYAPDAYAEVMPVGRCLAFANGRTFVGGAGFYSVSEYGQPFRFRPALAFSNGVPVERSATLVTLSGETVLAFATPSGSALNSQTVFFWTQSRTYACGGFDGYSLSRPAMCFELGCSAPGSVAQYKDAIFWLDDNLQVRRFAYGRSFLYGFANANAYDLAPAISRMVVDDQTRAIPDAQLASVTGLAVYDRYYLFFSPPGRSSNLKALVYEETLQAWVNDTLTVGGQSACAADLSPRGILLAGEDGHVYTHEDPNSTTAHSVRITSGEISAEMWRPQFFGRVGLVADVQTGQSATITVTGKPSATDSSTIDLATGASHQVWRCASRAGSEQPGMDGLSAQVDVQLTMSPGSRIYSMVIETAATLPGADQL